MAQALISRIAFMLVPAAVLCAQDNGPLHTVTPSTTTSGFGVNAAGIGDLNGDGVRDFLVCGLSSSNRVWAYSGLDGSELYTVTSPGIGFFLSPISDLDGDGVDDYFCDGFSGTTLFSGDDGAVITSFPRQRPATLDDVTGDGIPDFLLGGVDSNFLDVRSGADFAVIDTIEGFYGGRVQDVDGDGVDDIVASRNNFPVIRVYSGVTRVQLLEVDWNVSPSSTTIYPGDAGDLNADGIGDFYAVETNTNFANAWSGADGNPILSGSITTAGNVDYRYFGVAGLGDVNADGHDDILIDRSLISGKTAEALRVFPSNPVAVADLGDVDGDGFAELALTFLENGGSATVYRSVGHVGQSFCTSTVNSTGAPARLFAGGTPDYSSNGLVLVAESLPQATFGLFAFGAVTTTIPFGDGDLCVTNANGPAFRLGFGQSNVAGFLSFPVDVRASGPAAMNLAPMTTWNFQLLYRDVAAGGAGFNLSDGLTVAFN